MLSTKLKFLQNWTHIDLNINLNQAKMIEAAIIYSYVCFYSMSIPLFVHLKKKRRRRRRRIYFHICFSNMQLLYQSSYTRTLSSRTRLKRSINQLRGKHIIIFHFRKFTSDNWVKGKKIVNQFTKRSTPLFLIQHSTASSANIIRENVKLL